MKKKQGTLIKKKQRTLTKNQLATLELIAHGFTNGHIAKITQKSERTVEGARQTIVSKLGASNAIEAVAFAVSNGFVKYNQSQFAKLKVSLLEEKS